MPSTSTLVDSIYTRRVSAGECYPPDLMKSRQLIMGLGFTALSIIHYQFSIIFLLHNRHQQFQYLSQVRANRIRAFFVDITGFFQQKNPGSSTFHVDSRIFPAGLAIR